MKQITILLVSIFCVFLLSALIYQPIVANQNIPSILQQKEINGTLSPEEKSQIYDNSIESVKVHYNKVTDCGCDNPDEKFPIFCFLLFQLDKIFDILWLVTWGYIWFILMLWIEDFASAIGCDWPSLIQSNN